MTQLQLLYCFVAVKGYKGIVMIGLHRSYVNPDDAFYLMLPLS